MFRFPVGVVLVVILIFELEHDIRLHATVLSFSSLRIRKIELRTQQEHAMMQA